MSNEYDFNRATSNKVIRHKPDVYIAVVVVVVPCPWPKQDYSCGIDADLGQQLSIHSLISLVQGLRRPQNSQIRC